MSTEEFKSALQLEGKTTDGSPWVVPITHSPFVIGRKSECSLQLLVEGISRLHAEIREQAGGWWITDLDSTNGTFVNRQRCTRMRKIAPGDRLQFASVHFSVAETVGPENTTERTTIINPHAEQFERMMREAAVTPYFQPIVRFSDLTVVAYELLGRVHYEGLPETPGALFQIARKLDREIELSQLFREQGFLRAERTRLKEALFFNMVPAEMDIDLTEAVFSRLRRRFPTIRLVMELHESVVTNLPMIRQLRKILAEHDILLSYDDFGSGQARLVELMEVPPDIIKFDISLIHNIHARPAASQAIVAALVKMSKEAGIRTLAEGVENQQEAEVCRQMGFELAQGYHFGWPLPSFVEAVIKP